MIDVDEYKYEKLSIRIPETYKDYLKQRSEGSGISAYIRTLIERDYLRNFSPRSK